MKIDYNKWPSNHLKEYISLLKIVIQLLGLCVILLIFIIIGLSL